MSTAYLLDARRDVVAQIELPEGGKSSWPVLIERDGRYYFNPPGEEMAWFGATCPVFRQVPEGQVMRVKS